jgi:hypothetical protein
MIEEKTAVHGEGSGLAASWTQRMSMIWRCRRFGRIDGWRSSFEGGAI